MKKFIQKGTQGSWIKGFILTLSISGLLLAVTPSANAWWRGGGWGGGWHGGGWGWRGPGWGWRGGPGWGWRGGGWGWGGGGYYVGGVLTGAALTGAFYPGYGYGSPYGYGYGYPYYSGYGYPYYYRPYYGCQRVVNYCSRYHYDARGPYRVCHRVVQNVC